MLAVDVSSRTALYVLCRTLKPKVVRGNRRGQRHVLVFILRAWIKNAKVNCNSIDVPWNHRQTDLAAQTLPDEPIHEQPI